MAMRIYKVTNDNQEMFKSYSRNKVIVNDFINSYGEPIPEVMRNLSRLIANKTPRQKVGGQFVSDYDMFVIVSVYQPTASKPIAIYSLHVTVSKYLTHYSYYKHGGKSKKYYGQM